MDKTKLLEKIALLKLKAKENCFEYLPVATEQDVAFFENKFKVAIPEDLRWFVLNIANGIKNKISPVSHVIEDIDFLNYYYEENEYNPAIPFILTKRVFLAIPKMIIYLSALWIRYMILNTSGL